MFGGNWLKEKSWQHLNTWWFKKKITSFSLTELLQMEYFMIQIYKSLWTGSISWAINQGELLCKNTSRLSYSQTIPQVAMTNCKSQTWAVCWNAFLQAIKNTMTTYKFSKKNKLTMESYNYSKELFKVCDPCTKNDARLFDTADCPLFFPPLIGLL